MTNDELFSQLLDKISSFDYIHANQIPNIDLYMDQVTTFMDTHLGATRRYDEDKVLTKTMINNYAKNNLLPPPVKKKYSKEHVLVMIFIYYFKNILSIKDIESLLKPLTDKYFGKNDGFNITSIYEEVCSLEKSRIDSLAKDISKLYCSSQETFQDAPAEDREALQLFSFICSLAFDVYVKKLLMEKLIDQLPDNSSRKKEK